MIREDSDNNDAVAASFIYILLYCIRVNVALGCILDGIIPDVHLQKGQYKPGWVRKSIYNSS